jgi:hypothetical protein
LNSWAHTLWAGILPLKPFCEYLLASLKKEDLETIFRIWLNTLIPSVQGTSCLLVDLEHVSLGQSNVTLRWVLPQPLQARGLGKYEW